MSHSRTAFTGIRRRERSVHLSHRLILRARPSGDDAGGDFRQTTGMHVRGADFKVAITLLCNADPGRQFVTLRSPFGVETHASLNADRRTRRAERLRVDPTDSCASWRSLSPQCRHHSSVFPGGIFVTFPHLFTVSLTNLSPVCLVPNAVTRALFYIAVVSTPWAVYVECGS